MDVRISVLSDDIPEETSELVGWLRDDRDLPNRVSLAPHGAETKHLGGAVDIVVAALGSGGVAVTLTNSLLAWLRTRARQVSITVKTKKGSITIDASNLDKEETRELIEKILRPGDD